MSQILLLLLFLFFHTSPIQVSPNDLHEFAVEEKSDGSEFEVAEGPTTQAEESPASEAEVVNTVVSDTDLYSEFLNNNEPLYFDYIDYGSYDNATFQSGTGYYLSDILSIIKEDYYLEKYPVVLYAEMDCGNDGIKELTVVFQNLNLYCPDDDSTLELIIKNINNKLQVCHKFETWARSYTTVNYYGYCTGGGSNGASNYCDTSGYIDKNGKWNFIEYTEYEMDLEQLSWIDYLGKIPEVAATKDYEGDITFIFTSFDKDYYNYENNLYTFEVNNIDDPNIYVSSVYNDIFTEAGINILSPDEVSEAIHKKELQVGLTDEIKTGPFINYMELDYSSFID